MSRRMLYMAMLGVLLVGGAIVAGVLRLQQGDGDPEPWFDCDAEAAGGERLDEGADVAVRAELVASLEGATSAHAAPTEGIWIATKEGTVYSSAGDGAHEVVLDIGEAVNDDAYEQGLLDFAVSPGRQTMYVSFTALDDALTVVELQLDPAGEPVMDSWREVLRIDQPTSQHNGGALHVDAGGLLWVSVGDGGEGAEHDGVTVSDFEHDRAQDVDNLYGSILRIDPEPEPGSELTYSIPGDNPFVGRDGHRGEVWAYGLRNPWRFHLDEQEGQLWIGDVGQYCTEEIDLVSVPSDAGANFGWPRYEGARPFLADEFGSLDGAAEPQFTLEHGEGACSIVGGAVYRGGAEELAGSYVFTDSCDGLLRFVRRAPDGTWKVRTAEAGVSQVVSIGTDSSGDLLLVSHDRGVYRLSVDD